MMKGSLFVGARWVGDGLIYIVCVRRKEETTSFRDGGIE